MFIQKRSKGGRGAVGNISPKLNNKWIGYGNVIARMEGGVRLSCTAPPACIVGTPYSYTIPASGGKLPYSFAVTSGSLPANLILNGTTGEISGTALATGDSPFEVTATDAESETSVCSYTMHVVDALSITTLTIPDPSYNTAYSEQLAATGGSGVYTWSLVGGALPTGLTLDSDGLISGLATSLGAFSIDVRCRDSYSLTDDTTYNAETLNIAPVFSNGPIPNLSVQEDQPLTPEVSTSIYFLTGGLVTTYSLINAPLWLDIDDVTGVVSGTPTTGADAVGVQVRGTNAIDFADSNAFNITVVDVIDAPVYSGVPIPPINGNVDVEITPYNVAAGGHFIGDDPPTVYQLFNAPTGITINASTGVIEGTPTVSGVFSTLYVRATNNAGGANTDPFTADISAVVLPLFSRPFSETASLEDDATYARGSTGSVVDFEGVVRTALENESRFEGANWIENLFTDTTTTLVSGVATTAVSVGVGDFVFSMGAGSGTATFSGTATGSTGTLDADSSSRTAEALSITGAGTIIVTASVADLADIMLQNKTGSSTPTIPDEYVSVGVGVGDEILPVEDQNFDANWSLTDATEVGGELVFSSSDQTAEYDLVAQLEPINGATYEITIDVTAYSGSLTVNVRYGSFSYSNIPTTGIGTFSVSLQAGAAVTFTIQSAGVGTLTIGTVSVKRCDHGANVDGVKYSTYDNGNSVDGNGIVTEAQGAPLSGISLLMEPAATNYCIESEDISSWTSVIDAVLGADSITATAQAGTQTPRGSPSSTITLTAEQYILWADISAVTTEFLYIGGSLFVGKTITLFVDWANKEIETEGADVDSSSITLNDDGTYRVTMVFTPDAGDVVGRIDVGPSDQGTIHRCTDPDGTESVTIERFQIEQGSVPTSYIKTEGAAISRAGELPSDLGGLQYTVADIETGTTTVTYIDANGVEQASTDDSFIDYNATTDVLKIGNDSVINRIVKVETLP